MTDFTYTLDNDRRKTLGLVVLQSDETIEQEFRSALPHDAQFLVSRVASGQEVTRDSLQSMEAHLPAASGLFPRGTNFDAIGYGCTSGTAQIGADRIAELIRQGAPADHVTEPVTALTAACAALGATRLAFLSPYIGEVSAKLREVLAQAGIATPVFGSFNEASEARVARIDAGSVMAAARQLAAKGGADALFLSCTNLHSFDVIAPLEAELGLPVMSSNAVLLWHMARMADAKVTRGDLGRLFETMKK